MPRILQAALILVSGTALSWGAAAIWIPSRPFAELPPGEAYAVDITARETSFDLLFEPGTRYGLIVSNLDAADSSCSVTLDATPVRDSDGLVARRIVPTPRTVEIPVRARLPKPKSAAAVSAFKGPSSTKNRSFYLHVTDGDLNDPRQYARVIGEPVAEGASIRVYLDGQQTSRELAPGLLAEIVRLLDDEIIPLFDARLGRCCDVDGDGKLSVLLTPWLDRLQGGQTSVGGFVRSGDFQPGVGVPFGKGGDVVYLNSRLSAGDHLRTLLAHEYAHAVCISERLHVGLGNSALPDEEDWLNEAIAHVAERMLERAWTNLDYRVSRYLSSPAECPLVVENYYASGRWRNHGCRGATYLFLQWFVDQYGEGGLEQLVHSPYSGVRNLESLSGVAFEDLYRRWTIATLCSSIEPASGYQSISLCDQVGRFGLAGPRTIAWNVDTGRQSIELAGTSTAFLELSCTGAPGHRRIRFCCDAPEPMQITLVKFPADLPRVNVAAEWCGAESVRSGTMSSHHTLKIRVNCSPNDVVEMIACEQNAGELHQSQCLRGDELPPREHLASNESHSTRCYVVPAPTSTDCSSPVVIKVIVCDCQGRRGIGWAQIDPEPRNPRSLQLAVGATTAVAR